MATSSLTPTPVTDSRPSGPGAILVVDDHELVRLGVRALIQAQSPPSGNSAEVLEAASLAEALAHYERAGSRIEVVLLDLALPDTQGLSGLAAFLERFPKACIAVLSGIGASSFGEDALAQTALQLGARAFLSKSANLHEVVSFMRSCGLLGCDAVSHQAGAQAPARSRSRSWRQLKPHQVKVLQLVLEGHTNKDIARFTGLAEGTVKNYVSTLLLEFGMRSRAQLISSLR